MAQLGDMFPGGKFRRTPEETGKGERFEPGPLDLDSGVVQLAPRPAPKKPADPDPAGDEVAESD